MHNDYGPPREKTRTPEGIGDNVTPQQYVSSDHSFTLQTIMELSKSTGELKSSIDSLKTAIEKQETKIEALEGTVSSVTHKIYAAGVVLVILLTVGGFIVNKAWDMMVIQISSSQAQPPNSSDKTP